MGPNRISRSFDMPEVPVGKDDSEDNSKGRFEYNLDLIIDLLALDLFYEYYDYYYYNAERVWLNPSLFDHSLDFIEAHPFLMFFFLGSSRFFIAVRS